MSKLEAILLRSKTNSEILALQILSHTPSHSPAFDPPDLVTCTSNQVGAAFDGVGCAVFQNVVCAHVCPPLCCRAVGAVWILNNGKGVRKGESGAGAVRISDYASV